MYAKNKKPFCKVCADVGKTDTAHYVRLTPDPKSPVVCPTLLALECRKCFKMGHTVKYCTLANNNNNNNIKTWASIVRAKPTPQRDDNYKYYRHCEDFSRSPNLGEWLSEPSVELKQQEELTIKQKLYNTLYDFYKDNGVSRRHPERIGMVVDKLLECDIEELEEFMTNRKNLEDRADEIFSALHYKLDPPMPGIIHNIFREDTENNYW